MRKLERVRAGNIGITWVGRKGCVDIQVNTGDAVARYAVIKVGESAEYEGGVGYNGLWKTGWALEPISALRPIGAGLPPQDTCAALLANAPAQRVAAYTLNVIAICRCAPLTVD